LCADAFGLSVWAFDILATVLVTLPNIGQILDKFSGHPEMKSYRKCANICFFVSNKQTREPLLEGKAGYS
jgi:hypothetical protein